jgi:chorismate lyase/3-hydroxybenzoate synthase
MCPPYSAEGSAPLSVRYLDAAQTSRALKDERAMAAIGFGMDTRVDAQDPRRLIIGLPELGERGTIEVWHSAQPVQVSISDGVCCIASEEVLFAHLLVRETDADDLAAATNSAYQRLLVAIRHQGYPHLLRVWNYFPDINRNDRGLERYQNFCQGRHRALTLADFEPKLPAASALGSVGPGMLIYALASRAPGIPVENPRQVSAFRYPPQYGPKSPSFSRAMLKDWGAGGWHLYISGTASIVGHATVHANNVLAQTQETLHNLEALMERANRHTQAALRMSLLKIYVRGQTDLAALRKLIAARFGRETPALLLKADICRRDLLVEIEGIALGRHTR